MTCLAALACGRSGSLLPFSYGILMPSLFESARISTRPDAMSATIMNNGGATVAILINAMIEIDKSKERKDFTFLSRAIRCPYQLNHVQIGATVTNQNRFELKCTIAHCYQYIMNMNTVESCSSSILLAKSAVDRSTQGGGS